MIKINKIYNVKKMFGNSLSYIEYIDKYRISIWNDYTSYLNPTARDSQYMKTFKWTFMEERKLKYLSR